MPLTAVLIPRCDISTITQVKLIGQSIYDCSPRRRSRSRDLLSPTEPFNAPSRSGSMSDPSYTGANPLTPTDDLPPLPTLYWNDNTNHLYTQSHMRAYALAARAKRDAELDRLNRTLASIKESHVEAARIASERGEQLAAAEARVKELEHQLEIAEHDSVHQSQLYSEYAEEWTRERDTLQKRVAELEEKLIVMCVTQLKDEA